jgi:hypothetical protein
LAKIRSFAKQSRMGLVPKPHSLSGNGTFLAAPRRVDENAPVQQSDYKSAG